MAQKKTVEGLNEEIAQRDILIGEKEDELKMKEHEIEKAIHDKAKLDQAKSLSDKEVVRKENELAKLQETLKDERQQNSEQNTSLQQEIDEVHHRSKE